MKQMKRRARSEVFCQGDRVEIYRRSEDESWESYMDAYVGLRGIVSDPDSVINDPEALVRVTLDGTGGTHRLPQDCLRKVGAE
jgi:hypothetical protein